MVECFPEFLQRVADANLRIEGCSPADFGTKDEVVSNLRDHLNYVWKMSIAIGNDGVQPRMIPYQLRVKGFIQRLF